MHLYYQASQSMGGPIPVKDIHDLLPFSTTSMVLTLTSSTLKESYSTPFLYLFPLNLPSISRLRAANSSLSKNDYGCW